MESIERMLECPECGELMSALVLNDLNKCDNCGCHAVSSTTAHHVQQMTVSKHVTGKTAYSYQRMKC